MKAEIYFEKRNKIGIIFINRPNKLNAINFSMRDELCSLLETLKFDDTVHVIVLYGNGGNFSSGRDVAELAQISTLSKDVLVEEYAAHKRLIEAIYKFPRPVITAVEGYALGMASSFVALSDLSIAGVSAKFGYPQGKYNIAPNMAPVFMQRIFGKKLTGEIILLGELFEAQKALEYHFINKIVQDGEVLEAAMQWAEKIGNNPSFALNLTKRCLLYAGEGSIERELEATFNFMMLNTAMKNY